MDGFFVINPNGEICDSTTTACEILQISQEELHQKNLADWLRPTESAYWNMCQKRFSEGIPGSYTFRFPYRDSGIFITGNFSTHPSNPKNTRFQFHKTEEENSPKVRELKKALNDFTYIVSHDLNAPVRAVKTLSTWIVQDNFDQLDKNGQEQLQLLEKKAGVLSGLIDGVLQYSRIGRFVQPDSDFSIDEILDQVIKEVDNPFEIPINYPNNLPLFRADRLRIYQLFLFIIDNSIRYNDKKEKGLIEVFYQPNEDYFLFEIKDNGIGIQERHFEKIFKIFQKLHTDESRTGMGLTLSQKIIKLYGGTIEISSEPGNFTLIRLIFPKKIASPRKITPSTTTTP